MPDNAAVDTVALVRAALDAVDSTAPHPSREAAGWDDERVLAGLVTLESLARQVDVWRTTLAVEVDERSGRGRDGLAATRGCRTSRELIRRVTGAAQASVSRWLRLGRATHESTGLSGQPLPARFPAVAAAMAQGRINGDAALAIVDNLNPVRAAAGDAAVAVAEKELVDACAATEPGGVATIDADSVRIQAATWAAFLDQDGTAPPETDLAQRSLRIGGIYRGLVRIKGLLLPEVAAALSAFADACTNPRTPDVPGPGMDGTGGAGAAAGPNDGRAAPDGAGPNGAGPDSAWPDGAGLDGGAAARTGSAGAGAPRGSTADASSATRTGDEPDQDVAPADTRTRPQLLHDVLAMALGAAARVADQRSVAGNSPTVLVAVRQSDLANQRGTGAVFTGDTFGGPVPLSAAATRQLACAGVTQRVAFDELGAIVGLWSPERCFTGQQRRAITLRDGGCIIPGCQVPAGWCEVHHVTPHAEDPDGTHTSNGCLLCWFHHRTIETSGWEIRMPDGVPEVRAPAWLRGLTRAGPGASGDEGWRRATGSPTRILDTLSDQDLDALLSFAS